MIHHNTITDDQIRGLMRQASDASHHAFAEVCVAALERDILPFNPPTHVARQRCAEAINTGHYVNCIDKDLPIGEQNRLRDVVGYRFP